MNGIGMTSIQIPELSFSLIAPELILCTAAIVILLVDLYVKNVERINITLLALIGIVLAFFSAGTLYGASELAFSWLIIRDDMSVVIDQIFLIGAALIVLMSHHYSERYHFPYGEYIVLLLFSTLGMLIISASADLITLFLGVELVSITLFVLTGFEKKSLLSGEASLKYLLLGAFSSAFMVYGIAFIFGMCRTTNLISIGSLLSEDFIGSPLLILGFALLLVGLGFKIALAPFHMWAPDVYQGAPTPITAWIAAGSKLAGFIALVRVFSLPDISFHPLARTWVEGIWWLSLLTMIIGNAGALVQKDIKRMLAYSSIAHGGYLSMAFVSHNDVGLQALLFYLAAYLFMTIGAFAVVIAAGRHGEERRRISDFAGLAKRRPFLAAMMSLFLLSLAGMPPTAGFIGKVWLFGSAIQAQYYGLAIVGILTTLFSFYYYLRVIVYMYMRDEEKEFEAEPLSVSLTLALSLSALGVLILGVFPNTLMKVITNSVIVL
ncbi:MAG: NADH-quinone oxidoreductase subunit N [Candidatus Omnitrophota bacterium]|nr:MAG: NADH-quinone oxidoreductase subunit N [Candidatus Omnitrophota bacterium]